MRLGQILSDEIRKQGVISFARFMELALYCPVCGYYEKEKDIGGEGDFITSVAVGNLFGTLLAFQFSEWLEPLARAGGALRIVESGAHDGALARDILSWLAEHRAGLLNRIEYSIVEPSDQRRQWQRKTVGEFIKTIAWYRSLDELQMAANDGVNGVVFSNELLDAMPVRRFGWDARTRAWFEWGVGEENSVFVWRRMNRAAAFDELPEINAQLLDVLPDGYILETSPAAEQWWREAAGILRRGKLVTIDYGSPDGLLRPERVDGTLRAYSRHTVNSNVLASPGDQDLTAHVDFDAIRRVGETQGLRTELLVSQEKFLTGVAAKTWSSDSGFGEWTPVMRRQFQTLTHPDHFGRAFHVLVQSRE